MSLYKYFAGRQAAFSGPLAPYAVTTPRRRLLRAAGAASAANTCIFREWKSSSQVFMAMNICGISCSCFLVLGIFHALMDDAPALDML
jgi:hypothetical protein